MTISASAGLELIVRLTLFFSVVLLITRMLRRRWPVLVATAQDLALLGLLMLPIFALCGLSLPWHVLPVNRAALQSPDKRLPEARAASVSRINDPPIGLPESVESNLIGATPTAGPSSRALSKPVESARSYSSEPRTAITPSTVRRPLLPELTAWAVAATFYVAGCLFLLARIAAGATCLRQLLNQSLPVDQVEWIAELEHWRRTLEIDRPVRLVWADSVSTPMTFDWRGAIIVIPGKLERTATAEERRAAILHELIHVQRSDFKWQFFLRIVEVLYWFHPLQWLLSRSTTATRELVCDAVCARHLGATCYASTLIELAGRLRKSPLPAVGLAMARSSQLRQRLISLDRVRPPHQSRPTGIQVAALATTIAVLVVGAGALSPVAAVAQPPKSVVKQAPLQADPTLKVSGRLIDDRGDPFREVELKASIAIWFSYESKDKPVFLDRAVKTDRDGRFAIESLPRAKPDSRYEIRISSARFVAVIKNFSSAAIVKGTLGELKPSRLVAKAGRVLDPNGKPVAKAVVNVVAAGGEVTVESPLPVVLNERVETDLSGWFTVNAPAYREFVLIVHSDLGAIARLVIPEGTDALADIQLTRGVTVSGRVLARNGQPISGCVVSLRSNDDQPVRTELRLGAQELTINANRITDAEGRFRFSPVLGDFVIQLIPRGEAFRADSAEFRQAIDPPPFVPVMLRLDQPGEKLLTLIEAPTAKVSGTIRLNDGQPAAGVSVRLMIPPRGGNAYLNIGEAKTDQAGRYSFQAPIPLEDLTISTDTQSSADGKRLELRPANPKVWSARSRFGMLMIYRFDGDRTGLDCVLVAAGQRPGEETARAEEATGVSPDLLALERDIKIARDAYVRASGAAQTQQQKDLAHDLFPSKDLIARCMVLEAKHRGSRTAIGAMHWIMRMAAMNSNNPAAAARERLILVLRDHYVANTDVDLLIDEFPHGDTPVEAETLLRKIAADSPHDYVRATALFELAEVLLSQAQLYQIYQNPSYSTNLDAMIATQTSERTKNWMRGQKNQVERIRNAYRQRGVKAMTTEAERLYDQVVTQFPDVRRPNRLWEGPEDIRLVDEDRAPGFRRWTLAERADTKRFQMNNLRLDRPAPILEGTDYFQKRIRLSDFAGKVVVLTVTMDTVGHKEMYHRCSQLLAHFKGKPVVCLSVVPTDGSGGYSVRSIVRENGITWPIIRDTRGDRLAHRWCQETFPEVYIIDAQGLIRFHESGRESVGLAVTDKVKELLENPVRR